MRRAWDFISNNVLVATLVAALILAVGTRLRAPLAKAARWTWRAVTEWALRLVRRAKEALAREQPPMFDVSAYDRERNELKSQVEAWKREAVEGRQVANYGEVLQEFTALPEVRHAALVSHLAEMLPTTGLLMRHSYEVWQALRPRYKEGDPESAVRDLTAFVDEKARFPLNNAANALNDTLQAHRDPRAFLVCFYKRYREWRDWVHKLGRYLGKDVRYLPNYAEWWRYDDKWREELEQKIASPNLGQVRGLLVEYNKEHGDLVAMPKPDKPYTGPTQQGPGLR